MRLHGHEILVGFFTLRAVISVAVAGLGVRVFVAHVDAQVLPALCSVRTVHTMKVGLASAGTGVF